MNVALVIPAAGSGERLGKGIPKALVDVGGLPLLRRTLVRLAAATSFTETIVLAPADAIARFTEVIADAPPSLGRVRVLAGGATRQGSVAAGVVATAGDVEIVVVHDAARPLVDAETVRAVLAAARGGGAATVASRPTDSVRQDAEGVRQDAESVRNDVDSARHDADSVRGNTEGGASTPLDRSRLWLVETPQAFHREVLLRAHAEAGLRGLVYTDDASLVEAIGQQVRIVASVGRNLKVTLPEDLVLVIELLARAGMAPG